MPGNADLTMRSSGLYHLSVEYRRKDKLYHGKCSGDIFGYCFQCSGMHEHQQHNHYCGYTTDGNNRKRCDHM